MSWMKTDDFSPLGEVTWDVTEANVNISLVMRRSACCCDIIDDVMGDATEMFRCTEMVEWSLIRIAVTSFQKFEMSRPTLTLTTPWACHHCLVVWHNVYIDVPQYLEKANPTSASSLLKAPARTFTLESYDTMLIRHWNMVSNCTSMIIFVDNCV